MHDIISMKSIAKQLNDWTFTDYYYRLMLIARSMYDGKLPNGINYKWVERYLFTEGSCVFFHDKELGYMVAKYADNGRLNPYDEPTFVTPHATGYTGKPLENHVDCVIIRNNDIMLPTSPSLQLFAYRLAEATRTSDVNIRAQKTPVAVLCDDKQKLSFKRAMQQVEENEFMIYGYKNFDIDSVKAVRLDAPVVFDKLTIQKHEIWNECMTFLGINNANQDKRERLVTDEVSANNEQVGASGNVFLSAREEAFEEIRSLFGLTEEEASVTMREMPTPKLSDIERGIENDYRLRTNER